MNDQPENTSSNPETEAKPNSAAANGQASPAASSEETREQQLEKQLKEKENQYLYLYADFENFKKRSVKERSDLLKFGWEPVARDLLQTVDNLERALAHTTPETDPKLLDGLNLVLKQFQTTFEKRGVKPLDAVGKPFDPNLFEAVGQEPSDRPAGEITREESKGYMIHDRLLRPGRVIISMGPAAATKSE
ncbi:MAG: nucleotide exchange factor GrpE [Bacteriovoracia bacterium]